MVDFGGLINKAKSFASKNPGRVRAGLDKVEGVVNDRTGGKYADQIAKGAGAVENALGVPGEAKQAFIDEMGSQPKTAPVAAEPIGAPEGITPPEKI